MNDPKQQSPPIERLIARVQQSGKYARVSEATIRRIGLRQLTSHRSLSDAVDATKNKLHQIMGAYLESRPRYTAWLSELAAAKENGETPFRDACSRILHSHASTRERGENLYGFYAALLSPLAPIRSLLDVGCGLHPLALPWMGLDPDTVYHAFDIHLDQMDFLNGFFALAGVSGRAQVCDAVSDPPAMTADVALLMKVLPVLDQQDRAAGLNLLRALPARYLIVTFPTRTLGGRDLHMADNYAARFLELTRAEPWRVETVPCASELCFRIEK